MKINVNQIDIVEPTAGIDEVQLQELTDSIKEQGLSHPIMVRPANNLGRYPLASGEKRLLAARRLGWELIEAEIRDVDQKKGKEIRIHENLKRFNLPWHEQVVLVEELHKMRQEEHGVAVKGRPAKDEEKTGWSIRDTAEELGMGIGPLSEDLSLARALRGNAALAKVQDKKTAIRLVRIAAQKYQSEMEAGLPTEFKKEDAVYFGDSAEILKQLPPQSVDHCITDPPWIKFFDSTLRIDERTLPVFRELYRVLKSGAFLYIFAGLDDYVYYTGVSSPNPEKPNETLHTQGQLEKLGFQVSNTPLIWRKENALSRRGIRSWEYDRDFEFIIVAAKGSPALTAPTRLSSFKTYPIVPPMKMIHANEKPVALLEDLLSDCSYEGNTIIDPFAGSGVVGEACRKKKRHYILCEREKKYYDGIVKRMEAEL